MNVDSPDQLATLVSVATYRRVTGESASADVAVSAALVDAASRVEEHLGRRLVQQTITEQLPVFEDGRSYPTVTPVVSVSDPTGAIIDGNSVIAGSWNFTGPFDMLMSGPHIAFNYPRATITYIGGYTAATLPVKIRNAICYLAGLYVAARPVPASQVGATSIRQGDLAVTYAKPLVPGFAEDAVLMRIDGFRRQSMLP